MSVALVRLLSFLHARDRCSAAAVSKVRCVL